MTDARWTDVEDEIRTAARHFGLAARLYDAGGFGAPDLDGEWADEDLDAYRVRMALQHSMQSAHTSLEGGLKRIMDILGEEAPSGAQSHADLIRRASRPLELDHLSRPAILTPNVAIDVHESRRFRHRAMHDYDNFEPQLATPSVEAARRLHASYGFRLNTSPAQRFPGHLERQRKVIRDPAS